MTKARDLAGFSTGSITNTTADGLILKGDGSSTDVIIKNDADATVFTVPTGTDDILFPDNAKILMGAGSDLQIFHDGSNSYIREKGTGILVIDTDGTTIDLKGSSPTEYMARFIKDGAVSIYYDNAVKLATASAGVTVTGTLTATAFAGDGSALTDVGSTTLGAVGTYGFMYKASGSDNPGTTVAGSTLKFANTVGTSGYAGSSSVAGAGSWRLMGSSGKYSNGLDTTSSAYRSSLWVRYA